MLKRIGLVGIVSLLLIPFQNCSSRVGESNRNSVQRLASIEAENGGQPYDGKPYIFADACLDGTRVQARLVIDGDRAEKGGILYRENCQTAAPKRVSAGEIQLNGDSLKFQGRTFKGEKPSIPLPGFVNWYYQLQGTLKARAPSIYIIDMFDTSAQTIQALKASGHTVICSISAGTVENWRPDAGSFLNSDRGNNVQGAQGERWLDTRSSSVRSVMLTRLDTARDKGCHGIDFDSVDGYANNTGFPLNSGTQLEYNQYLAFAAHDRQLILALNNAPELAPNLSVQFDFAIAEQCFQYDECQQYDAFIRRGKPVLAVEYTSFSQALCTQASAMSLSLAFTTPELDGSSFDSCY